jgi:hypothetical protein
MLLGVASGDAGLTSWPVGLGQSTSLAESLADSTPPVIFTQTTTPTRQMNENDTSNPALVSCDIFPAPFLGFRFLFSASGRVLARP